MPETNLPEALAAELAADPAAFRPAVQRWQHVLILDGPTGDAGILGSAAHDMTGSRSDNLAVYPVRGDANEAPAQASAWVLYGRAHNGDLPRPDPGDRCLALGVEGDTGSLPAVVVCEDNSSAGPYGPIVGLDPATGLRHAVTSWGILPTAPIDNTSSSAGSAPPEVSADTEPDLLERLAESVARARSARDPGYAVPRARRDALLSASTPETPGGPAGFDEAEIGQALSLAEQQTALVQGLRTARATLDCLLGRLDTNALSGTDAAVQALARCNTMLEARASVARAALTAAEADGRRLQNALTTMTIERDELLAWQAQEVGARD